MSASTETSPSYVVGTGSSRLRELERLERQADLTFDHEFASMVAHGLADGSTVVDVGSGNGAFTRRMRQQLPAATIYGSDVDPTLLKLVEPPAVAISGGRIDLEDASVDAAVVRFVAQHLLPDARARLWSDILRIVRPGGTIHVIDVDDTNPGTSSQPVVRGLVEIFAELHNEQASRGGDRRVIRKIPAELESAGFEAVDPCTDAVTTEHRPVSDFGVHMGPERFVPLVAAGALTLQQLAVVGQAWEALRRDPDAYVSLNVHTVHARRPLA